MAFNPRRYPHALLALALGLAIVIGLVAPVARADVTLEDGVETANVAYNGFTYTIGNIKRMRAPVDVVLTNPTVTGGGLSLVGWDDNSVRGEYAFRYMVSGAIVTDSSLIIKKGIPADGLVSITSTQANNAIAMPAFDFSSMVFTFNLTMQVTNTIVTYSQGAANLNIIEAGNRNTGGNFNLYTALFITGVRSTGGRCLLNIPGPSVDSGVIIVNERASISVSTVNSCGLSTGVLCLGSSAVISSSSAVRVQHITAEKCSPSAGSSAPQVSPKAVIYSQTGTIDVVTGSLLLVKDITARDSSIIESARPIPFSSTLSSGSTMSMLDFVVKDFCTTCSNGVPSDRADGTRVFAKNWTLSSGRTADYNANNLGGATMLDDSGRNSNGVCEPASCLPTNIAAAPSTANPCTCNCKPNTYSTSCLDKSDPTVAYKVCDDENCADCSGNAHSCAKCRVGYQSQNGVCVRIPCQVPNCRECEVTNQNRCAICSVGFGLVNGECKACTDPYCAKCDGNAGICTACINDYGLDENGRCISSSELCGVPHCINCVVTNNRICTACEVGYALTSSGQCVACNDPNCASCTEGVDKCTSCKSGYTLTQYGTCSPGGPCNVHNCAYCDAQDNSRCSQCINGYIVNTQDGSCVKEGTCLVENCVTCVSSSPNVCDTCAEGYARDSTTGLCVKTSGSCNVANCAQCKPGEPTVCAQCNPTFTVSTTGSCVSSSKCRVYYCSRCQPGSDVRCQVCSQGYGITTNYLCVKARPSTNSASGPSSLLLTIAVLVMASMAVVL